MTDRAGASFGAADVVENYRFRPPYPEELFQRLVEIAPARSSLLDIGCGPGKISRPLAPYFENVVAVDPSANMLALGHALPGGTADNISWIEGFAEDFAIHDRTFDLTVAAASLHWMDRGRLFPRLAAHSNPGHIFALVSGDDAFEPDWEDGWVQFLEKWIPAVTGTPYDAPRVAREWEGLGSHITAPNSEHFLSRPFTQTIDDFISCQHSRDTWAPSKLGAKARRFDQELRELLMPFANDGFLCFQVRTKLVWGEIASP